MREDIEHILTQQQILDRKLNRVLGMLDALAWQVCEIRAEQNPEHSFDDRMKEFYAGADGASDHHAAEHGTD